MSLQDPLISKQGVLASPVQIETKMDSLMKDLKHWTSESVYELTGHDDLCRGLLIDGDIAWTCSDDKSIRSWDLKTQKEIGIFNGHTLKVNAILLSHDKKNLYSCSNDETIRIWNLETFDEISQLNHESIVFCMHLSKEANLLMTAGQGDFSIRIWDLSQGVEIGSLKGHGNSVYCMDSSENILISGSADETLKFWDFYQNRLIASLDLKLGNIFTCCFSSDNVFFAIGTKTGVLRLFTFSDKREYCKYEGHTDLIFSAIFSEDNRFLISSSHDQTIRFWSVQEKELAIKMDFLKEIWKIFINEEYFFATCGDFKIKAWRLGQIHKNKIVTTAFEPIPQLVHNSAKQWKINDCTELKGHEKAVWQVLCTETKIITSATDTDLSIIIWNIRTLQEEKILVGHSASIWALCLSPDENFLYSSSDDMSIKIWDLNTYEEIGALIGHTDCISNIMAAKDGKRLVSTASDKSFRVWDLTFQSSTCHSEHQNRIISLNMTSDDKTIVFGTIGSTLKFWDIDSNSLISEHKTAEDIYRIAFTPDEKYMVLSSDSLFVWNYPEKTEHFMFKHTGMIGAVLLTEDSKYIITASNDKQIRIWLIHEKEMIATVWTNYIIHELKFTKNKQFLVAACGDSVLRLWKISGPKKAKIYENRVEAVLGLSLPFPKKFDDWENSSSHELSGHSSTLLKVLVRGVLLFSSSFDFSVVMWNLETFEVLKRFEGHTKRVDGLCVSSDCKTLYTGSGDTSIKAWDIDSGLVISELNHQFAIYSICLYAEDTRIASGGEGDCIKLWDLTSHTLLFTLALDQATLSIDIDIENKILVAGIGFGVQIWNLEDCTVIHSNDFGEGYVDKCIISPNQELVAFGTRNSMVKVLQLENGDEVVSFEGHVGSARALVFTNDSELLVVGDSESISIWSIPLCRKISFLDSESSIWCVDLEKENNYLVVGLGNSRIRVWDLRTTQIKSSTNNNEDYNDLALTNDEKFLLMASEGKSIEILDLETNVPELIGSAHESAIMSIAITSDTKIILSGAEDGEFKIWDYDTRQELASFSDHDDFLNKIVILSDNSKAITCSSDDTIILWDITGRCLIHHFKFHSNVVTDICLLKDERFLLSCSYDKTIRVFDLEIFSEVHQIDTKLFEIQCVCISANEDLLAAGTTENSVIIWDWATKREIIRLQRHNDWVRVVKFVQNDLFLVTSGDDSVTYIWSMNDYQLVSELKGHSEGIRRAVFTKDEKMMITSSFDKSIRFWSLDDSADLCLFSHSNLESFIFLFGLKKNPLQTKRFENALLSNLKVNYLHIFCYLGNKLALKSALENTMIRQDIEGHSPLYYSLKRNSQACVDTIFEYLIDISQSQQPKFLTSCYSMRNDFYEILKNKSIHLQKFLNSVFCICHDSNLPNFAVASEVLPQYLYSDVQKIQTARFLQASETALESSKEIEIEFKSTPIPLSLNNGSAESIRLLKCIRDSPRPDITETEFVLTLIRLKWKAFFPLIMAQTLLWWLNIIFMVCMIVEKEFYLSFVIVFILTNALILIYEFMQVLTLGLREYADYWNLVDLLRAILAVTFTVFYFEDYDSTAKFYITWLFVSINFIRGLSGFRAFDQTRFYIRLIIRSVKESFSFILIFFYSTIAFGLLYTISTDKSSQTPFELLWKTSYELNLGNFNNSSQLNAEFVYFMFASVFNVIIMLNLLISILGDSFDKFQLEAVQLDCMEMLEVIIEIEGMMYWNRDQNEKTYLQVCQQKGISEFKEDWQGKILKIQENVNYSSVKILEKLNQNAIWSENMKKELQIENEKFKIDFYANQASLESKIERKIGEQTEKIKEQSEQLKERTEKLEKRIESIDNKLDEKFKMIIEMINK